MAAKYMPQASIKIGVDLDPIKPIKGCITFTADITTARCTQLIKKEIKDPPRMSDLQNKVRSSMSRL